MNTLNILSLIIIMLTLAAIPSASVALVVTRSATAGFKHGVAVSLGIVTGDLIFVMLAVLGMSALAEALGAVFLVIRYLGGMYLIWLGVGLLRARPEMKVTMHEEKSALLSASYLSGVLLTLGDVKAIFFYASLFPAFIDMRALSVTGVAVIVGVTAVTVGGVKLFYAACAQQFMARIKNRKLQRASTLTAGGLMVGAGAYLIIKS